MFDKEDFPGCDPVPMTWEEVLAYDGRIYFWDGDSQTAWLERDTNPVKERIAARFSDLTGQIGRERDALIVQEYEEDYARGYEQGYALGCSKAQAEMLAAQLDVVRRIASRKFDQAVVARVLGRLGTVDDVGRLTELSALVAGCDDGDELEARLAEAMR